ncbi:hypothetical protein ACH42_07145 [Endozoicomonas sp. (ex Bugula neritina AB1)]|nr:hypothetical protein ACH42_07145 [Endozoicomonas sp. (ex Bugula neritina AB1)]
MTSAAQEQNSNNAIAVTTPGQKHPLDWVPRAQLSATKAKALPFYSCGAYVEPARPGKNFKGDPNAAPIVAEANTSDYDESNVATLAGNVNVSQASRQLTSDTASLDRDTNYGQFEGNVHFREPGVLLLGNKGDLQLDTGRATLENSTYVIHEDNIRGGADLVVRNEDGTLDLTNASYTTCPPGDKGWLLSGGTVSIDQETGIGVAKNATVKVQGLPVFYTPWMTFPIDDRRMSGFLYPTIASDSDNGFDFSIPYYWNIAPNYDATITPRVMTKRGLLLENEFRYLVGNTIGEIGLSGTFNKDKLQKENPYYDEHRWLVNINQKTQLSSNWKAEIDYAKASDKKYFDDFDSNLNTSSQNPLNQSIRTRYDGTSDNHNWYASIDVHQYQNMSHTSDDPYNKLPAAIFSGNWNAGDTLDIGYTANYTKFSRDKEWSYINETLVDDGYGIKKANGERMYLETSASYPMEWSYAFLTPSIKIQHVQYQLSNLDKNQVIADLGSSYYNSFQNSHYTESPKTTVPTVSIDSGLYFDRSTDLGGTSFTHTLEPRMKYLYSPYVEGQEMNPIFDSSLQSFTYNSLWRDSRFSGYDRLGDNNQISLGVTSRLIEKDGFERARISIGQAYYLKDRRVWISSTAGSESIIEDEQYWEENLSEEDARLRSDMTEKTSPVASELIYSINRSMSLRQDLMWDTNNNEIHDYGLYYVYKPYSRSVFNVGYRYRDQTDRYLRDSENANIPIDPKDLSKGYKTTDNNMSQTDISFAWPVMQNWSALGRWQYDITNKRNLEQMAGVEYNSCCYQVRLLWRNWIEDDSNIDHPDRKSGFFLQFVLRGLGDLTGGSAAEYLDGIKGYEWDEK